MLNYENTPLLKCTNPQYIEQRNKEGEKFTRLVPCRSCIMCKKAIANQWAQRILYESSLYNGENCFITLTYNDENVKQHLDETHTRNFLKRLRKKIEPTKIKYFYCGEYGETTLRPHYHFILMGYLPKDLYIHHIDNGKNIYSSKTLDNLWTYGFNQVGSLKKESIYYTCGYILKNLNAGAEYQDTFRRMSLGLGKEYAIKNKDTLIEKYKRREINLPRYLVEKLKIDPKIVVDNQKERLKEFEEKYGVDGFREYYLKCKNAKEFRDELSKKREEIRERRKL